ncbi:MAG: hypothetical protein K0R90_699 [Oscillospiraceae bacterium]|nr:hypothetical protein [Oscillospiraceae bacterium]
MNRVCEKCKSGVQEAVFMAGTDAGSFVRTIDKGLFRNKESYVTCFVCPECGNIEFVAKDASIFKR